MGQLHYINRIDRMGLVQRFEIWSEQCPNSIGPVQFRGNVAAGLWKENFVVKHLASELIHSEREYLN